MDRARKTIAQSPQGVQGKARDAPQDYRKPGRAGSWQEPGNIPARMLLAQVPQVLPGAKIKSRLLDSKDSGECREGQEKQEVAGEQGVRGLGSLGAPGEERPWQDCGKDTKMSEPRTKERIKELKQFIKKAKLKKQGCLKNELEWFKQNTGKIVISRELAQIPGREGFPISHNVRRVFELRDEQGYDIVNHKSNEKLGLDLKVDEWILLTKDPDPKKIRSRGVNKRIMFDVFTRDNSQCQFCGRTKDDDDPFKSGHKIKLHVGHIIAHKRKEGSDFVKVEKIKDMKADKKLTPKDFITMCNVCNEGAKNKDLKILNPVEKVLALNEETQKSIFNALKKKFS